MPSELVSLPITTTSGDGMKRDDGEVRIVDPKTGGEKGVKDTRFDLLPPEALEEIAKVYGFGAKKYDDNNWAKGYSWRLSFGAMMRHAWAWFRGEDYDPETGLHHMAHVAWHCLTIMTFQKENLGTDDRLFRFIKEQKVEQNRNGDLQ
jgi:hypothetical protein